MALLTDSQVSEITDLQESDNAILEVAKIEGIDLSSKLKLAEREIGLVVQGFLARHGGGQWPGASAGTLGLENVVVNGGLKRWHTLRTLALVYEDAYYSQLNDRYLGKWNRLTLKAKEAGDLLFRTGIGLVNQPISRPGLTQPKAIPGSAPPGTYVVCVAWRGPGGATGAPSQPAVIVIPEGGSFMVEMEDPPPPATAYDVFVRFEDGDPGRQNPSPIPAAETWTLPDTGVVDGPRPGNGQAPEFFVRLSHVLQRG